VRFPPTVFSPEQPPWTAPGHVPDAVVVDIVAEQVQVVRQRLPASTVNELRDFYRSSPNGIILAPLPRLGDKIALTAWTHLATCTEFDEGAYERSATRTARRAPSRSGCRISRRAPSPGSRLSWVYEPLTFALRYGSTAPSSRRSPRTLFLPEIGIYIELTRQHRRLGTRPLARSRAEGCGAVRHGRIHGEAGATRSRRPSYRQDPAAPHPAEQLVPRAR
jgi:hypothetical protein